MKRKEKLCDSLIMSSIQTSFFKFNIRLQKCPNRVICAQKWGFLIRHHGHLFSSFSPEVLRQKSGLLCEKQTCLRLCSRDEESALYCH